MRPSSAWGGLYDTFDSEHFWDRLSQQPCVPVRVVEVVPSVSPLYAYAALKAALLRPLTIVSRHVSGCVHAHLAAGHHIMVYYHGSTLTPYTDGTAVSRWHVSSRHASRRSRLAVDVSLLPDSLLCAYKQAARSLIALRRFPLPIVRIACRYIIDWQL